MATSTQQDKDWFTRVKRAFIFSDGSRAWSFDAVIRESHTSRATITRNPVETGVKLSDHAFMEPNELYIEAAVGDVWLHGQDQNGNAVSDVWASDSGRAANAWRLLKDLQENLEPITVQTGLDLYEDVMIEQMFAEQDAETASVLFVRVQLVQVIRADTQTVSYPPRASGKSTNQASKKVTAGEKKTTDPESKAQAESVLHQGFGKQVENILSFFGGG